MPGGRDVRDFGNVMYTLLYLKWVTHKDLLYGTQNSPQCYVVAWMGGEFGGEWIHVYPKKIDFKSKTARRLEVG